jgi:hypothetical protein
MILFRPASLVPDRLRSLYRLLRIALFAVFIIGASLFAYHTLFPSQEFLFSFSNPETAKNTLEDPVGIDGTSLRKGRVASSQTLQTFAGTVGAFSSARVRLVLEKDSALPPDNSLHISLRKSYRSYFLPEGDSIRVVPKERGLSINGVPYLFQTDTLYPFVSDKAALSRFPKEKILAANDELLTIVPLQESVAGFRTGALLSDAQGVYAIDGDGKAHPIGSTEVFESLGLHWNDVIPVSEEELGFHKRGKIFLFDSAQPDGTIFYDTVKDGYSIVQNGKRLPIENREYLEPLLKVTTPIDVSSNSLSTTATCTLERTLFSVFHPTYICTVLVDTLKSFSGGSFSIALNTDNDIHVASLTTTFSTKPDQGNFSLFLRQIRDRFSAAYGKR